MPVAPVRESGVERALRIKTSTLRRTMKDVEYARREVDTEQARLQTMRAQASDRVSQQEQVLREAEMMVPHAHNRCTTAQRDLADYVAKECGSGVSEKLLADAHAALAEAQPLLEAHAQ